MNNTTKATLIGFSAIIFWSAIVGLIKEVSNAFGAVGGSALMYTVAFIFLVFSVGWVPIKKFPKIFTHWWSVNGYLRGLFGAINRIFSK